MDEKPIVKILTWLVVAICVLTSLYFKIKENF